MYEALYKEMHLDWEYGAMDCATPTCALKFLREGGWMSVNVTTPYKPEAFDVAQLKASSAKLAKGVNLLVRKDEHLIGYNVDGEGCITFLERKGVNFGGSKVAVCGTGPTAMSIVHAAAGAGADDILLLGRDRQRTERVLNRYLDEYRRLASSAIELPPANPRRLGFTEAYEHAQFRFGTYTTSTQAIKEADIIIDATTLGMNEGDPAPFSTSLLHSGQVVLDTVYGHGETEIVRAAKEVGAKAYDGAGMLVSQAVITATIVCEVNEIDMPLGFDEAFMLMANAAKFQFSD